MNDPEEVPLKAMIVQAIENCTDVNLLDLIYKLLAEATPEV